MTSPGFSAELIDLLITELCQVLNNIISDNPDHVIWIAGDINFSNINWTSNSIRRPSYLTLLCDQILDLLDIHGLTQIVDFPTRVNNILDVFITTRPSLINHCNPISGLDDHEIVYDKSFVKAPMLRSVKHTVYIWAFATSGSLSPRISLFQRNSREYRCFLKLMKLLRVNE